MPYFPPLRPIAVPVRAARAQTSAVESIVQRGDGTCVVRYMNGRTTASSDTAAVAAADVKGLTALNATSIDQTGPARSSMPIYLRSTRIASVEECPTDPSCSMVHMTSGEQFVVVGDVDTVVASLVVPQEGPIRLEVEDLPSSTTQTQGEGQVTKAVTYVSTVDNTNDTITLPLAEEGLQVVVVNGGIDTLQIFPATGDAIDWAAANAATTLATHKVRVFWCYAEGYWASISSP